jgi:hypothetical protein
MEMGWRSRWAFGVCDSIPQKALLVQVDRLRLRLRGGPLPEVAKTIILFFLVCRRLCFCFCFLTLSASSVQGRVEALDKEGKKRVEAQRWSRLLIVEDGGEWNTSRPLVLALDDDRDEKQGQTKNSYDFRGKLKGKMSRMNSLDRNSRHLVCNKRHPLLLNPWLSSCGESNH